MEWKTEVPIFRDSIILKQMGFALGIPFGLVVLIIGMTSGRSVDTLYALGSLGMLFLLSWIFVMAVYGGKYEVEFTLDQNGVLCRTGAKQAKRNRIVNRLTIGAGLLSGKPAVAGAGFLAGSKQSVFLGWSRIKKARYQPSRHRILLKGGLTENIALFCTKENYDQAAQFVRSKVKQGV